MLFIDSESDVICFSYFSVSVLSLEDLLLVNILGLSLFDGGGFEQCKDSRRVD